MPGLPPALWLRAVEVTLQYADQNWASGLLILLFFPSRLISIAKVGHTFLEVLWAGMPDLPHPLNSVGPRSHEIYSKTCGFHFCLQNILLCFTGKKVEAEHIVRIWNACHLCEQPLGSLKDTDPRLIGNSHETYTEGHQTLSGRENEKPWWNSLQRPKQWPREGRRLEVLPKVKCIFWLLVVMNGWQKTMCMGTLPGYTEGTCG